MLAKVVKDREGYYIGVECLGIAKVIHPRVVYYGLDEDLVTALSSHVGLVVLESSNPGSFGANTVNARSFRVDRRVITGRTGG